MASSTPVGPRVSVSNNLNRSIPGAISHITSDGSSHSYIDQDVTINSEPTFFSIQLSNTTVTGNSEAVTLGYLSGGTISAGIGLFVSEGRLNARTDNVTLSIVNNTISIGNNIAGAGLTGTFPISVLTDNVSIEIGSNGLQVASGATGPGLTGGSGVPVSVLTDNTSIEIDSNTLRINTSAAGDGLTGGGGSAFAVSVDSSSIEIDSGQIRLASGIAGAGLTGGSGVALSVTTDNSSLEINSGTVRVSSGAAGNGLAGGSGVPLAVSVDNQSMEIESGVIRIASGAVASGGGLSGGSGVALAVVPDGVSVEIASNQLRIGSGIAGDGLSGGSGTPLSVQTDSSTLEISSNQIRVGSGAAGDGLAGGSGTALSVQTDSSTLEISGGQVRLASGAAGNGLIGGSGSPLAVGAGTGITVNTDDIELNVSQTGITQLGILQELTVTANTAFNSNLTVLGESTIGQELVVNGVKLKNLEAPFYYNSVSEALNRLSLNNRKYFVNNSTELISALSVLGSVGGGVVELAPATFEVVSSAFSVPNGVTLQGNREHSVIKKAQTNNNINIIELGSNTVIRNLTIDCNQQENTSIIGNAYGIYFDGKSRVCLDNLSIKNFGPGVIPFFGGVNTTEKLQIIDCSVTTPVSTGGTVFIGNLEDSLIRDNRIRIPEGAFIGQSQTFSNVEISSNEIASNVNSGINTIGNCFIQIYRNDFSGAPINIQNVNTGTTGAVAKINYTENDHHQGNGPKVLTVLGSNSETILNFSSNYFNGDYSVIHNNGIIRSSSISNNYFDRSSATSVTTPAFTLDSANCAIQNNLIVMGNVESVGFQVNTSASVSSIGKNYILETPINPSSLSGVADVYSITTTTATSTTLGDLNKESRGHRIEITLTTDGGDLTVTPTSFLNGNLILFNTAGDRAFLTWDGNCWFVSELSGAQVQITDTSNVGGTNVDTISTVRAKHSRDSGMNLFNGAFNIITNSAIATTNFTFKLPSQSVLSSNSSVKCFAMGYNEVGTDISDLFARGNTDGTNSNIFCSFTSIGGTTNVHTVMVSVYY